MPRSLSAVTQAMVSGSGQQACLQHKTDVLRHVRLTMEAVTLLCEYLFVYLFIYLLSSV